MTISETRKVAAARARVPAIWVFASRVWAVVRREAGIASERVGGWVQLVRWRDVEELRGGEDELWKTFLVKWWRCASAELEKLGRREFSGARRDEAMSDSM